MENKVLEENLQAIKRYDENLVNKILTIDLKKSKLSLIKNENDDYNILFFNIPLHSISNAKEESEIIAKKIEDKNDKNAIRIIYGLGLGYLLDEVANTVKEGNIILYEPNLDVLKYVFEVAQIDALYKENVFVATNKKELITLIKNLADEDTKLSITFLHSYKMLFEKDILNVLNTAQKVVGEFCAKKNMERKNFGALLYSFLNLRHMIKNPDVIQLLDVYKGKTALIASAGSTLSENIDIIRSNQDKFVIFAVNQSANYLAQNGVKSDFIVNVDVYDNHNQFKDIKPEEHYFIFEAFSYFSVFSMPSKKTFNYISDDNFYNYWFRDCMSIKHGLKTAGTVSISAFLSAVVMGFDKIILIGQDLAYKDGKCYAKGSIGEELECVLENDKYVVKAKNWETFVNSMKKDYQTPEENEKVAKTYLERLNTNIYTIKGQNGELLPTQVAYSYFVDYFSQLADILKSERPSIKLINSSTGGAQIDGFENIDLKTVVKDAPVVEKLNLEKIEPCYDKEHALKVMTQLYDEFYKVNLTIQKVHQIASSLLSLIEKENTITENIKSLILEQNKLLNELFTYNENKMARCILDEAIKFYNIQIPDENNEDINKIKEFQNLLLKKKDPMHTIKLYMDILTNCKSLVLQ